MRRSKFMAPKEEKKEPEPKDEYKKLESLADNIVLTDDSDRNWMLSARSSSATEINPNLILPDDLAGALIVWRGATYAIQEMSFNINMYGASEITFRGISAVGSIARGISTAGSIAQPTPQPIQMRRI